MDRREFFRRSVGKAAETITRHVDKKVNEKASHWIRPPYALPELEFLLACTRCGDCITACPYQVIFPLAARLGADVMGTPSLDLLNKGCHLCDDWPCVHACETNALVIIAGDEDNQFGFPNLANARIDTDTCLPYTGPECGACSHACQVDGALNWKNEKPTIDEKTCVGCGMCREACIVENKAISIFSLNG